MALSLPAAIYAAVGLLVVAVLVSPEPAHSAAFTDAAGRRVMLPERINRILPAERNAEVLVFVLAPDRLAGIGTGPGRRASLPRGTRPMALRWRPRSTPDSMAETALQVRADLIIDAGTVTPERAAFADAVEQLTGIPYILVDSSFERTPLVLRSIGAILGVAERADDLRVYAEHAIAGLRGRLLVSSADTRLRVYYALGADGLTTALPGSPTGAAIDEAGAINVAAPLGRGTEVRISREQLLAWDPEIIIAERRSVYDALRRSRAWRQLAAARNKRVYLEPGNPFGWIEHPSGVNRLIGLSWLSTLFHPDATQEDLRSTTCAFYDKFYRSRLTNAQIEAMVGPAGAPPPETRRQFAEPLVGLGAAPPSALPPDIPGASEVPSTPSPAADPGPALCTVPGAPAAIPGMYTAPPETSASPLPGLQLPGTPAGPPGRRGRSAAGDATR